MILGKLQRAHPNSRGNFAPAYLVGSNKLRAYLCFIYGFTLDFKVARKELKIRPSTSPYRCENPGNLGFFKI